MMIDRTIIPGRLRAWVPDDPQRRVAAPAPLLHHQEHLRHRDVRPEPQHLPGPPHILHVSTIVQTGSHLAGRSSPVRCQGNVSREIYFTGRKIYDAHCKIV